MYANGDLDSVVVDDFEEDPVDLNGTSGFEKPITILLISAELNLPHSNPIQRAKVVERSRGDTGATIGTYDNNHKLNTMIYDV